MKCPSCGSETQNNYCEFCGNELSQSKPNKKTIKNTGKKIWLWVLGWIFIFPLPLTIILLRKKNIKPIVKYAIIAVAWLVFLTVGLNADNEAPVQNDSTTSSYAESSQEDKQNSSSTGSVSTETSSVVKLTTYAADEVVNRFINEFNSNSTYEITNIRKGNIRTKYFGYANNRYLEMINANDAGAQAFCLTINGGQTELDKQAMFEVFKESIKILDSSITDDVINDTLTKFNDSEFITSNYRIGKHITVTYIPIVKLSSGISPCRIDISASNYK